MFNKEVKRYTKYVFIALTLYSQNSLAQSSIEFEIPFIVNDVFVGDISAVITEKIVDEEKITSVTLPAPRLKTLLEQHSVEEQMEAWFQAYEEEYDGQISLSDMRDNGLQIVFDPGLLEVKAKVKILGISAISVADNRDPQPNEHFAQSKVASGLSVFARSTFNHRESAATAEGFDGLSVDFLGFTTIGGFEGWSLFYEGNYDSEEEKKFERQDVVLLHDDFKRGLRYSVGDITPTVSDLQSTPELLGIGVERNYEDINPFRNLNPSGRSSFTLDRVATVSFEINGSIVSERVLQPGNYSLSDFPLTFGANNVRIFVDDGTSRSEVANFSTFVDLDLLDQGLSNFGVNVGVRRESGTGRSRQYESDPVLVGFYERGLTQSLTAGVQVEAGSNHALIGSKAVYGSRVGVIGFEANVSKRKEFGRGVNSLIRFEANRLTKSNWYLDTDIQLRYQSENYVDLTNSTPTGEQISFNSSLSVSKGSLSYSLGANFIETNDQPTRAYTVSLFKSFKRFTTSLSYQHSKTDGLEANNIFSATIAIPLGGRLEGSRLRNIYRSRNNAIESSWSNPATIGIGRPSIEQLSVNRNTDSTDYNANFNYIGSRFELDARHSTSRSRLDNGVDTSQTTVNAAGAIGFADGKFAYGKPFSRGFIVVNAHKTLRGKKLFVKQSGGQTTVTTTKRLRTTLVPINNSYNEQRFEFEVDDLPLGYDLGGGDIRLYPGNLAGYNFTLGSDAANTVLGKAFWPDNTPLNLKSGKLMSRENGDEFVVFTNRTGRFVAEKVKLGNYTMVFTKDNARYGAEIELKESGEPGLIQIGKITLERLTNES